jgi:hypothetical protein
MKRTLRQVGASALAFTTVLALAQLAEAQDAPTPAPAAPAPEPAPAPAPATAAGGTAQAQVGGGAQAQGGGAMTLPGAAPAAQAAPGDSDHDQVVGNLGIGYLGLAGMSVGCSSAAGASDCTGPGGGATLPGAGTRPISAPVIGIRYWIDQTVGIDAGIGMAIGGSSLTNNAPVAPLPNGDVPQPGYYAFLIHAGLPLSLASSGHYSFQIIPEANVGFGGWSQDRPATAVPPQPQGFSGSGFRLDVGARAGAEIHFGFIGLPKLALQGSVGLLFAMNSTSIRDKEAQVIAPTGIYESKGSQISVNTTVGDNPWNIFISNVAALYYF